MKTNLVKSHMIFLRVTLCLCLVDLTLEGEMKSVPDQHLEISVTQMETFILQI